MECFELLETHLKMCGIIAIHSPKKHSFNAINLAVLFLNGVSIYLYANLFREAITFEEYTDITYNVASACFTATVFTGIILKTSQLFRLVENFGKTISLSK